MSLKTKRLEKVIREIVSEILLHEISDPRMGFMTVTKVAVAADIKSATIHVSVLGTEGEQTKSIHGLRHAAGHIQEILGRKLRARNTPVLSFVLDTSAERAVRLSSLIDRVVAEDASSHRPKSADLPALTLDEPAGDEDDPS